jgi:hypothetical protein
MYPNMNPAEKYLKQELASSVENDIIFMCIQITLLFVPWKQISNYYYISHKKTPISFVTYKLRIIFDQHNS